MLVVDIMPWQDRSSSWYFQQIMYRFRSMKWLIWAVDQDWGHVSFALQISLMPGTKITRKPTHSLCDFLYSTFQVSRNALHRFSTSICESFRLLTFFLSLKLSNRSKVRGSCSASSVRANAELCDLFVFFFWIHFLSLTFQLCLRVWPRRAESRVGWIPLFASFPLFVYGQCSELRMGQPRVFASFSLSGHCPGAESRTGWSPIPVPRLNPRC